MKRTIYLLGFLWAFLGQLNAQFDISVDFGKIEKPSYIKKIIKLESGHILQLGLVGKKNYRVHFKLFWSPFRLCGNRSIPREMSNSSKMTGVPLGFHASDRKSIGIYSFL